MWVNYFHRVEFYSFTFLDIQWIVLTSILGQNFDKEFDGRYYKGLCIHGLILLLVGLFYLIWMTLELNPIFAIVIKSSIHSLQNNPQGHFNYRKVSH